MKKLFTILLMTILVFAPIFYTTVQAQVETFPITFYLDPQLVPDQTVAATNLQKYVTDMNYILQKNTVKRVTYSGLVLTSTQPHNNNGPSPLPETNFQIWAHAVKSDQAYSYGGYMGLDSSGAGVLAGLKWTQVYNPDSPSNVQDYWTQVNNMLHELAHVFGAGSGEYYNLAYILDTTNTQPILDIDVLDLNDSFWKDKPSFYSDPLLRSAANSFTSRYDLLNYVEFSNLTSTILNGHHRNGLPTIDLNNVKVKVVGPGNIPIQWATVKIWSVIGASPYSSSALTLQATDANGEITFAWGGTGDPHNNYDFLRLIKVYMTGYESTAKYISIFDTDIEKLVYGHSTMTIQINMRKQFFVPYVVGEDE